MDVVGTGTSSLAGGDDASPVSSRLQAELEAMQRVYGADDSALISALPVADPTGAHMIFSGTIRMMIGVLGAGVVALFAAISIAEARATGSRDPGAERAGDTAVGGRPARLAGLPVRGAVQPDQPASVGRPRCGRSPLRTAARSTYGRYGPAAGPPTPSRADAAGPVANGTDTTMALPQQSGPAPAAPVPAETPGTARVSPPPPRAAPEPVAQPVEPELATSARPVGNEAPGAESPVGPGAAQAVADRPALAGHACGRAGLTGPRFTDERVGPRSCGAGPTRLEHANDRDTSTAGTTILTRSRLRLPDDHVTGRARTFVNGSLSAQASYSYCDYAAALAERALGGSVVPGYQLLGSTTPPSGDPVFQDAVLAQTIEPASNQVAVSTRPWIRPNIS